MRNTERFFILILIIVGGLIFYSLSIFFDIPRPKPKMDGITSENEEAESETITPTNRFAYEISDFHKRPASSYDSGIVVTAQDSASSPVYSDMQKEILERNRVIPLSIEQKKFRRREELVAMGYQNESFIIMEQKALERDMIKEVEEMIPSMNLPSQTKEAVTQIQRILDDGDQNNYRIRAEVLEKAIEIALSGGNIEAFHDFLNQYIENANLILGILEQDKFGQSSHARARISDMKKKIDIAKKGELTTLLLAIRENKISSLDVAAGVKADAHTGRRDGKYQISTDEIQAASDQIKDHFRIFQKTQ